MGTYSETKERKNMSPLRQLLAMLLLVASAQAFTTPFGVKSLSRSSKLFENSVETPPAKTPTVERGVSVDQDGKSNVWAIEPKMEVSTKSSEETTKSALIAGVGLIAAVGAAGVILTNLPDPNQF